MKIEWLGHACFLFVSEIGTRIITDPYDDSVGYPVKVRSADIVTISHSHHDHNNVDMISGSYVKVEAAGDYLFGDIPIKGISVYHDNDKGSQRGTNLIFTFKIDGLTIAHMGDLGHLLDEDALKALGQVDILLVPAGGKYTLDNKDAFELVKQIDPKITIPMHYKTDAINLPISGIDEFTDYFNNNKLSVKNEIVITKTSIDSMSGLFVFNYEP